MTFVPAETLQDVLRVAIPEVANQVTSAPPESGAAPGSAPVAARAKAAP
jgi:hypothetical protein